MFPDRNIREILKIRLSDFFYLETCYAQNPWRLKNSDRKNEFWLTLFETYSNNEFFLVHNLPYSVPMRENTDQKKLRIWTISRSANYWSGLDFSVRYTISIYSFIVETIYSMPITFVSKATIFYIYLVGLKYLFRWF